VGRKELEGTLAATHRDLEVEGWSLGIDEPLVCGAGRERLNIVV
jgi:hypothetical protein